MAAFSIDSIWEEMTAFLRREHALLLPLALATFGLALLLIGLAADTPGTPDGAMPQPNPRTLLMVPGLLMTSFGNLVVSLVVLRPGASVAESLRLALTRVPAALGILGLGVAATFLLGFLVAIVLVAGGLGTTGPGLDIAIVLIMVPALWVSVRLLVIWPTVADAGRGPIASLKTAFALTRGHALKALGITMIFLLVYLTLVSIAQLVLTSLFGLIGLALGHSELLKMIVTVAVAFVGAVLMMGWTVYLALTYRRLKA